MTERKSDAPRGLLHPRPQGPHFSLERYEPAPDLAFFVMRHWVVRWDFRGLPPHEQRNIPYPCVNLFVQRGQTAFHGVRAGRPTYLLEGEGLVFGVKFLPGSFEGFYGRPVAELSGRTCPVEPILGLGAAALEARILDAPDVEGMIRAAEAVLRARLPPRDPMVERIHRIVEAIVADRDITKVDHLVSRFDIGKRTLERLFHRYVGATPKWVISRYRLHEAAEQLAASPHADWTRLAGDLGYFDQAHFIRDFKAMVGVAPGRYAQRIAERREAAPA